MLHYSLLFIHVISAMAIFTALGMEAVALGQLHRAADHPAVRPALTAFDTSQRVSGVSSLMLVLSGIALASAYWHWQGAWMGLGLVGLVAIGAVRGAMTGRVVRRIGKSMGDGRRGASVVDAIPLLRQSFAIRAALLAGVVYLMTVKPAPPVALGVLAMATVVGLLLGRGARRAPESRMAGASQ